MNNKTNNKTQHKIMLHNHSNMYYVFYMYYVFSLVFEGSSASE